MLNIDRHIAISAGWVAGPAFGVAMMAAPEYFHLAPLASGLLFWGGIIVFVLTIAVVVFVSLHEEGRRKAVLGPIVTMAIGALIFCGGAAWYFWPHTEIPTETGGPIALSDFRVQLGKDKRLTFIIHYENTGAVAARKIKIEMNSGIGGIQELDKAPPAAPIVTTSFTYADDLTAGKGADITINPDHVLSDAELSAVRGKPFASFTFGTFKYQVNSEQITERFDYWVLRKPGEDLSKITKMTRRPDFLPPSQLVPR